MDIQDVKDIWDRVKDELEVNLPEHIFRTWVTPLEAVDYENNTLVLLSPHQMAVDILKKAIAIGCDDGVLISDKKFAGADTYATAKTIASAIKTKM